MIRATLRERQCGREYSAMSQKAVFLIEDDTLVRDVMTDGLREEGYTVVSACSALECSQKLAAARPDIILLDLVLPDGNGLGLIKGIRARTNVPVIIISGKSDLIDKVVGLEMGADDYVGKPIQIKEVTARIRAQIRRYQSMSGGGLQDQRRKNAADRLSFGRWIFDRARYQVYDSQDVSVNLTAKEFQLLDVLLSSPHRVFTRELLLEKVRADNYGVTDRAIDVQIMRIRRKLGGLCGTEEVIRSIRGVGYMFVAETEAL